MYGSVRFMSGQKLRITLKRSLIGCHDKRRRTAKALGLRRVGQSVIRPNNESVRGMVKAIEDLVTIEVADED
jgi:large subunit ribosomal protein L30